MSLFDLLVGASRRTFLIAVLTSLVCGGANALLVVVINQALHRPETALAHWLWPFVASAGAAMGAQVVSRALFAHLGQQSLGFLRRRIARAVVDAPYRQVETTGKARIQALLTDDSNAVAAFFLGFPVMVTNSLIVTGCLGYLAYLSPAMFAVAIAVVGLGSAGYHRVHQKVLAYLRQAGHSQDHLFAQFESLVSGAKELKLNRAKADRFLDTVLSEAIDLVCHNRSRGLSLFAVVTGWGRFLFMVLIGMVLFTPLWLGLESTGAVTGYVVVFLFVMGPLEGILIHVPSLNMAKVALGRIGRTLESMRPDPDAAGDDPADGPGRTDGEPVGLTLSAVTHAYFDEREGRTFTLGPVSLSLTPGTTTFLVGGNGCGKTTLAKVITGLYTPESGAILVNGRPLDRPAGQGYRQLFATVFADYHLFETLLAARGDVLDRSANAWLHRLHLDHKVSVSGGAFTTRDLSLGQRKRLALIAACLEDRPVMVFDEWAADQDPEFKEVFYRDILPQLKARGKTLLVITHDDRYFPLADQMIKLERGQVVSG